MSEEQKNNVKKWLEALRSGKYQQGRSYLCRDRGDGPKYCCLGVACEILKDELGLYTMAKDGIVKFNDHSSTLPVEVQKMLGLRCHCGQFIDESGKKTALIHLNDYERATFEEIADVIESKPEGLFVDG